jgi:ATP-dependent DNA helicase RecG
VQAVVTARVEGGVTNGRMQELTGEHPKDITDMLRVLVRQGFLVQLNQRRWASYRLSGDSHQLPTGSPHSTPDSPHSSAGSPHSTPDSPHSSADSPHSTPGSLQFPADLWALAEPARQRARLPSMELRELIASLCQGRWLTARELGQLLERNAENLQTRFLTAMVREGRLILRHPDVPNRPDQAYATAGTVD